MRNQVTNFVESETGAFPNKSDTKELFGPFGTIPVKTKIGSSIGTIITEMRKSHIDYGKSHKSNFSYLTNKIYGSGKGKTGNEDTKPWANMQSNF